MIYFLIAFSLFVGNNVLAKFGLVNIGITPATYLALMLFSVFFIKKFNYKSFYRENKTELIAFLVLVILFCYKLIVGHKNFYAGLLNALFFPVLTILMLQNKNNEDEVKKKVFKIIIAFFVVECSIAIIEKVLHINFFPATMHLRRGISAVDDIRFRSAGLQNHALQNVLCIITMLLFILYSDINNKKKLLLSMLGTFALLSFNSRMSILVWGIVVTIYLLSIVKKKSKNLLSFGVVFTILFLILGSSMLFIIVKYNLAGRLLSSKLMDDSGLVRIKILNILWDYDLAFFIKGHSQDVLDNIILAMEILAIENFWIIYLLKYGLIFLALIVWSYAKIFKKYLTEYQASQKWVILITFLFLASTNNSLDVTGVPLMLFIISAYSFPKSSNNNLKTSEL